MGRFVHKIIFCVSGGWNAMFLEIWERCWCGDQFFILKFPSRIVKAYSGKARLDQNIDAGKL